MPAPTTSLGDDEGEGEGEREIDGVTLREALGEGVKLREGVVVGGIVGEFVGVAVSARIITDGPSWTNITNHDRVTAKRYAWPVKGADIMSLGQAEPRS